MSDLPPAPASDAVVASAPAFIVSDQWDDAEWRGIAARHPSTWTEAEKYIWAGGPRPHPWGRAAFIAQRPDGAKVTFPNKDAHDKHMAEAGKKKLEGDTNAEKALAAMNAGLAAQKEAAQTPVQPASDPQQAAYMLESAAPHGSVVG